MARTSRSLWGAVLKNFVNSFKFKPLNPLGSGIYVGKDNLGNKFYEIPAEPSKGQRYAKRWFVPQKKDSFTQNISAEWEAWLRNRRDLPPEEGELKINEAIAFMKKDNAAKIAEREGKAIGSPTKHTDMTSYPVYEDFEVNPGEGSANKSS